jgi:hypothetical protein
MHTVSVSSVYISNTDMHTVSVSSVYISNTDMHTVSVSSFISNTDKDCCNAEEKLALHHDIKLYKGGSIETRRRAITGNQETIISPEIE